MKAWWLLWSVWLSIVATRAHSAKPEAQTASGLYDLVEPSIAEPADDEQALAPLLLVSTVDGQLHGLKRNSGQWLWSLHSENASFTPQPLVQSSTLAQQSTSADGETYILEPVSGGHIYIHQRHQDSTTKLPLTLAELVDMSPFVFPSQHATSTTADRMFVGSRTTSLIGLDLSTGRLVGEFGQGNGWCEWRAPGLAEAPEDEIRRRPQDLLYVGRTEYNLSILSKSSGSLIQSLAFTSYHPSSSLRHTDSPSRSPADQRYFQPTHDGTLVCFQSGAGMAWASQPFGADESNPIINIFDIAIDHAANAPVLHAHPSLLHAPGVPRALSELQKLPDAAYVGLLKDNATPFAMSRSHFPLIDPVRRSPTSVQDEPEACQGAQCLVGLRKLEEPAWHRSAVMPAPSRLAIDDNPHVEEHPSTLPSPESLLTLPPAPPHHYATSTIKLTSLLVVLATCVVLLLRQKYLNRRLFAPAPVQAKQHQQPRVRLQEPEVSPDLKEKALPPLPQSTETAPDEDDYSGEGTPGATSKRSKRRGKRGKRAGQKVAALNNANDAPNATIGSLCVSDEILGTAILLLLMFCSYQPLKQAMALTAPLSSKAPSKVAP